MSTYWYLRCADHDPPLRSVDEVAQHTDDESFQRVSELVRHRPLPHSLVGGSWLAENAVAFIRDHPTCRLQLVSEYGDVKELEAEN